jgi:hypothetical protein
MPDPILRGENKMRTDLADVDDGPVDGSEMVVKWQIRRNIVISLEVDTEALQVELPPEFTPTEVRPGIGLMFVGALEYWPGIFGQGSPGFNELFCAICVHPDLSMKMPAPRFCFYATTVYSGSADFCRVEAEHIHTPTHLVPSFDVRWAEDGTSAVASDEHGPIITMQDPQPAGTYKRHYNKTYGGAIQNGRWTGGALMKGPWEWDGWFYEHQKNGDWGSVHQHKFFGGIDVSRVRGMYRLFIAQPERIHIERFYAMRPM